MEILNYQFDMEQEQITIDFLRERYHLENQEEEWLIGIWTFLTAVVKPQAAVCYGKERVTCAVTLGRSYDKLCDVVAEGKNLMLSYLMDCFGMELLSRSYERLNEAVKEKKGAYMGTFVFVEDVEKELTEEGRQVCTSVDIVNRKGMLYPLKSVIFTACYEKEQGKSRCQDCRQCENVNCSFRSEGVPNSYGICLFYRQ